MLTMLPSSTTGSSSVHNSIDHSQCSTISSDDDDSDHDKTSSIGSSNYKERRREAHTQAEQKRRDAIKKGYSDLQLLVPSCTQQDTVSSYKLSKAAILQRSIDYMQAFQQQKNKREKELQLLRKEALGLEIMKTNYEEMVKQHQKSQAQQVQTQQLHSSQSSRQGQFGGQSGIPMISDDTKFEMYKTICDSLFHSFDSSVRVNNFNELSASTIAWLEEHCKPNNLRLMVMSILDNVNKNELNKHQHQI